MTIWPESLYKLIHREDIINNLKLLEAQDQIGLTRHTSTGSITAKRLIKQGSKKFAFSETQNIFSEKTEEKKQLRLQK